MERYKYGEEICMVVQIFGEQNLLKDNLALRKNVMDLVAFDGNQNSGSSAIDIEVEGGRLFCGVEGEVEKMLTMKQKIKVIKKEK
ncbi:hypothetical protein PVK06_024217 [Gossypium arboreum]|uniref:Uncharacterized protein n=1 Tax=Gossypium arboreum TaxID=29729 RepID=A0ABR0PDE0_GOSAR|nr:hypothetical protein PVK06_024217 [Gossypium arboreum]